MIKINGLMGYVISAKYSCILQIHKYNTGIYPVHKGSHASEFIRAYTAGAGGKADVILC